VAYGSSSRFIFTGERAGAGQGSSDFSSLEQAKMKIKVKTTRRELSVNRDNTREMWFQDKYK
jgi:hypothetical protein